MFFSDFTFLRVVESRMIIAILYAYDTHVCNISLISHLENILFISGMYARVCVSNIDFGIVYVEHAHTYACIHARNEQ